MKKTSILRKMNNDEHLDIGVLINYAKEIYSGPGSEKDNYIRIVRHLANCTECLNLLQDIRNLKEDFDKIWDNFFPLQAAEILEQSSPEASNVLQWISSAKIRKELAEVLGKVESFISESINHIVGSDITSLVTTHGVLEEGKTKLYFIDSLNLIFFESIVYKDNVLIFRSDSDPGYKSICIVGPGQLHRITSIIKYGEGKYIAKLSDVKISPEGCFVHLY